MTLSGPEYCLPADLYDFGMPRGAAPNPGRLVDAVSVAADTLVLGVHGFEENSEVLFRAEPEGALPDPLEDNTTYYAEPVTQDVFKVRATAGGVAINLTSTGDRVIAIAPLPVHAAIGWASRIVDGAVPSLVPLIDSVSELDQLDELVRVTTAELAAAKLLGLAGTASKTLTDVIDAARKRLEKWARGKTLRQPSTTSSNLAASAASAADSRGWSRYGGL